MSYQSAFQWPQPSGEFQAGYQRFQLTDPTRPAMFGDNRGAGRTSVIHAFYPAEDTVDIAPIPYMPSVEIARKTLAPLAMIFAPEVPEAHDHCAELLTASFPGAPIAEPEKKKPVVVFHHGGFSYARQNQLLCEELASHGYVVYAIEKAHESSCVQLDDGQVITVGEDVLTGTLGLGQGECLLYMQAKTIEERKATLSGYLKGMRKNTWLARMAQAWREDALFIVDAIEDGDVPAHVTELAAASDTNMLAYCGMSFGAGVSALLAESDVRCKAAIDLDGGFWSGEHYNRQIRTPFLLFTSDMVGGMAAHGVVQDPLNPLTQTIYDIHFETLDEAGQRKDVPRLMMKDIHHIAFSDLCIVTPKELRTDFAFGAGDVVGPRYIEIQNRLALDFFNQYVRGIDTQFPEAQLADAPELVQQDLAAIMRQPS